MPFCYQFWFVRDLIVLTLISPIIYLLIKRCNSLIIIILTIWWLTGTDQIRGYLNPQSLLFFYLGSYIVIGKCNFVYLLRKFQFPIHLLAVILVIYIMLNFNNIVISTIPLYLKQTIYHSTIFFLICSFVIISLGKIEDDNWQINRFLKESNFFIYGYHAFALSIFWGIFNNITPNCTDTELTMFYVFAPLIIITLGLTIFAMLKKLAPKLIALLIGSPFR